MKLAGEMDWVEALVGNTIQAALIDKGYRGHNAPRLQVQVFIIGERQRMTPKIKHQMAFRHRVRYRTH